ncbi:fumble [Ramicandelaber brevisporus]|nr:fumble [Ramicandelaber brevisporus]
MSHSHSDSQSQSQSQVGNEVICTDTHGYFGVDIGGTLVKVIFYDPPTTTTITTAAAGVAGAGAGAASTASSSNGVSRVRDLILSARRFGATGVRDVRLGFKTRAGGTFHFVLFETQRIENAVAFIKDNIARFGGSPTSPAERSVLGDVPFIRVTGGGSFKYKTLIESELGVQVVKVDEMRSLIAGVSFLLEHVPDESYAFRDLDESLDNIEIDNESADEDDDLETATASPTSADNGFYKVVNVSHPTGTVSAVSAASGRQRDHAELDAVYKNIAESTPAPDSTESATVAAATAANTTASIGKSGDVIPRILIPDGEDRVYASGKDQVYPYLLCNVGTGVSILKVTGESTFERVSGSGIGGGTFLGLSRMLTQARSFREAMTQAKIGDSAECNMTVGDIYGDAYSAIGLKSSMVASFFAKPPPHLVEPIDPSSSANAAASATSTTAVSGEDMDDVSAKSRDADINRALLLMITNNIGQIVYLNARLHGIDRIYFAGNFLRKNRLPMRYLARAIKFWSQGQMTAYFFRHEGYFGACGAYIAPVSDTTTA